MAEQRISLDGVAARMDFDLPPTEAALTFLGRDGLDRMDFLVFAFLPGLAMTNFISDPGAPTSYVLALVVAALVGAYARRFRRRGTYADNEGLILRGRFWSRRRPAHLIRDIQLRKTRFTRWHLVVVLGSGRSVWLGDISVTGDPSTSPDVQWEEAALSWWLERWKRGVGSPSTPDLTERTGLGR